MHWTRRWGIIGSIAVAQLGAIIGYQAFLTGGPAPVSAAQTVPEKSTEAGPPAKADTKAEGPALTMPAIPLPPSKPLVPADLPIATADSIPVGPLPASTGEPPLPTPGIQPVSAVQDPNASTAYPPAFPAPQAGVPGTLSIDVPAGKSPPPPTAPLPPATYLQVAPTPACPWNLTVEIVDGRTRLTAQNGKEVKFTISCEKLEVQTPRGRIEASGKVQLATEHLEGGCDRLTISWQEDVVVLEKVQLKCRLQGQDADLVADQLRLRLSRVVPVEQTWFFSFYR